MTPSLPSDPPASSPPPVRLRIAGPGDAAHLSALGSRLFKQTFADANTASDMQDYLAHAFTTSRQAAELAVENRIVWVAETEDGGQVGYASMLVGSVIDVVPAAKPAEVERIYVDRTLHGRKVGDLLMDACIARATDAGCDAIWLAVWEHNPRAIAFYERRGFRRVGTKEFQLGSDVQHDYVMSKPL